MCVCVCVCLAALEPLQSSAVVRGKRRSENMKTNKNHNRVLMVEVQRVQEKTVNKREGTSEIKEQMKRI